MMQPVRPGFVYIAIREQDVHDMWLGRGSRLMADALSGLRAYTVWGAISGLLSEGKEHRCVSGAKSGPKFSTPSFHPDCLSHGSR